jgi:hypothetical protein
VIYVVEISSKFQNPMFWKEISIEDVIMFGPIA